MKIASRFRIVFLFVLAVLAVACTPSVASAGGYSMPRVAIDAVVCGSGDLRVSELRTFEFDESVNGVFWTIPCGLNEQGGSSAVAIEGVSIISGDSRDVLVKVDAADAGDSGVYTAASTGDAVELKVFAPHDGGQAVRVQVDYVLTGAVMAWEDTAELYWKFIGPDWGEASQEIELRVGFDSLEAGGEGARALMAAAREAGSLRAWGHGPLDATVEVSQNGRAGAVVYRVPVVWPEEFAEARIAFPLSWVSEMSPVGESRLDTILDEERAWAEEANEARERARRTSQGVAVLGLVASAVLLGASVYLRFWRYKSPKPVFQEDYFRDVPSDDHPAVIAAFFNGGAVDDRAFISSLMKLTDDRVIDLKCDSREEKGIFGTKAENSYSLELIGREKTADVCDSCALDIFFGPGARNGARAKFGDLSVRAQSDPEGMEEARGRFEGAVNAILVNRGLDPERPGGVITTIFIPSAVLAIALGVYLMESEAVTILPIIASIAMSVTAMVIVWGVKRYTLRAVELMERCRALKRWLEDFTMLDEAVPSDLVLWNKLLVMGVALGVSDEVLRQLAQAVPPAAVREDEVFGHGWFYYWGYGGYRSPYDELRESYQLSAAELAGTQDSSAGGFGGGFSGGGGGGVGGGGGGTF